MDPAAIYLAIKTRLAADTGTGGLRNATTALVTAIYNVEAPAEAVYPYLVCNLGAGVAENAFALDNYQLVYRVKSYVEAHPDPGGDQMLVLSNITKRIFGDSSAGSAPSYGLHRHKLTLTGSWSSTALEMVSPIEAHELPEIYSIVHEFRGWVFK